MANLKLRSKKQQGGADARGHAYEGDDGYLVVMSSGREERGQTYGRSTQ